MFLNYALWSSMFIWLMYRQVLQNNPLMGSEWLSQPPTFSASLWEHPHYNQQPKIQKFGFIIMSRCLLFYPAVSHCAIVTPSSGVQPIVSISGLFTWTSPKTTKICANHTKKSIWTSTGPCENFYKKIREMFLFCYSAHNNCLFSIAFFHLI